MKTAFRYILFSAAIIATLFSCQQEEFITDKNAILEFSQDTIMFDTVFTTLGTVTEVLKVYNRYDKSIEIDRIELADGKKNYRLNIDGYSSNTKRNTIIAPHDSLFIFIEATIDPNDETTPMVVQDSILFFSNGNRQDIDLVAWGQDINIINETHLYSNTTWASEKPYLVYNFVYVDSTATLTIEKGTRIYFHDLATMFVNGNLQVNGTKDEPVIFTDDRLDSWYDVTPGYWYGITLIGNGKRYHKLEYAEISNAINGIEAYYLPYSGSSVMLNNVSIYNMSSFGIIGIEAAISAANTLVANCGLVSFYALMGGDYEFYNCTFANYYGSNNCPVCSPRTYPSVLLSNYFEDEENGVLPALKAKFTFYNSIIYGSNESELEFDFRDDIESNYIFENCILRVDEEEVDVSSPDRFMNIIKNPDEHIFENPWEMNFQLDSLSPAIDMGNIRMVKILRKLLEYDMNGNSRMIDNAPDIGAFERVEKEDENEEDSQ